MSKHFQKHLTLSVLFSIIVNGLTFGQTQWTENGLPVQIAKPSLVHLTTVSDGRGGAFLTWQDSSVSDIDIFAQWLDGSGNRRWTSSGITVSAAGLNQVNPAITPDASGGLFVAWQDDGSESIYAQHLNNAGTIQWGTWGILVCGAAGEQTDVRTADDGNGGILLVWRDKRSWSSSVLYAQRLNLAGIAQWTADGIPVTDTTGSQSSHTMIEDGQGGIYIVWAEFIGGQYDIRAQRISNTGNQIWSSAGVVVCSATGNQVSPAVDTSGNALIVSWTDSRNGNDDIYAQALDAAGNALWTADGIPVCTNTSTQNQNRILGDGTGGALVVWTDVPSNYNIYAQALDFNGIKQWTAAGVPVTTRSGYQYGPELTTDGHGGAFIVWNDNPTLSNIELSAQHLLDDGSIAWNSDGLELAVADGIQYEHEILSDGSGGFLAFWQDGRDGRSDLYAQHINGNIAFIQPAADTLWAGDQSQTVRWTMETTGTLFDHLSVFASETDGDGYPIVIAQDLPPDQLEITWTADSVNSTTTKIRITAEDGADSVLCQYTTELFTVDSDPPDSLNLLSPPDGNTVDLQPTFLWTSTTDSLSGFDHYELWIGGLLVEDNLADTSHTLTSGQKLASGATSWKVHAVDKAGLIRQSVAWNLTAVEDTTAPSPFQLLSPPDQAWTTQTEPTFLWEAASDPGSGLKKYQFYLNTQLVLDDIPPSTLSTNSVTLTPGDHSWSVTAVDSFGNTSSSPTWRIKLDNVPPRNFSLSAPLDAKWIRDVTPTFLWEASDDTSTGIGLAEYQLWIDDFLVADHILGDSTSITLSAGSSLTEGSHDWYVVAKDSLGNSKPSMETFTVRVDTTLPDPFALTAPADHEMITDLFPTFSWESSGDALSGLWEYELWIDGGMNMDSLSATSSPPASVLSEGSHSWSVIVKDAAGNTWESNVYDFIADTTSPLPFALITPEEGDTLFTDRPTFIWEATTDSVSGFSTYQFYLDGQVEKGGLAQGDTTFTSETALDNGPHRWKIWAWDQAGNVRLSESVNFLIAANAPQITSSDTATATEDIPFVYAATADDPDGDNVILEFLNRPSWLTTAGDSLLGTPTEGTPDTSFLITATDGFYIDSLEVNLQVLSVNDAPVLISANTAAATEDVYFAYDASATDPEDDPLDFTFLSYPTWLFPAGNRIEGSPDEGRQDTSFVVIVSDGDLTDTLKVSLTVTPVNDPPVISSASSIQATEDQLFTYMIIASDPEDSSMVFHFADSPGWLTPSGNVIQGIPVEGTTDTSFVAIVSDGELSDSLHVSVTVHPVNDAPVLTCPDTVTATEDIPLQYTGTATDPEDSTLFFNFSDYPSWLHVENNSLLGAPLEGATDTSFVITVSDGQLTDTLCVNLGVIAVNDTPVIVSPDTVTATEAANFIYRAVVEDVDGPQISITYKHMPNWLSPSGPEIFGTPPNGSLDTTFTLIASDTFLSDTLEVFVIVQPVNDPPCFDYPLPLAQFSTMDSLTLHLNLDDYVSDPDHPDSLLTWSYTSSDTSIQVSIEETSHIARIQGQPVGEDIDIAFTVTDPLGAAAMDTLRIDIIQTGIESVQIAAAPREFTLYDNYPNPFNPSTTVRYGIPRPCYVRLVIYNMLGQEVETLVDNIHKAGTYEILWEASSHASGFYFIRMQTPNWNRVKRMVLMR